jgi:2-methylcitrate dehydratase PrpD
MNESLVLAQNVADVGHDDRSNDSIIDAPERSFLDALGLTLAASTLGEGSRAFVDLVIADAGAQESSILGSRAKAPALMTALANGSVAHAPDFEDVHDGAPVHADAATVDDAALAAFARRVSKGRAKRSASSVHRRLAGGCNGSTMDLGGALFRWRGRNADSQRDDQCERSEIWR